MSAQLDPEDYREIMQAYQEMCGHVLARFTGHIARYEGDGILVYFGYPIAQEEAAAQAVRAGLHIIAGLPGLNARFQPRFPLLQERPLQVRVGLHTGLVVVGEMGSEQYRIEIAVGETPQLFPMLISLWVFHLMRWGRELPIARELAEQLMRLAQSVQDPYQISVAHGALGCTLFWLGEFLSARAHIEQSIALYDPQKHPHFTVGTADHRVDQLSYASWTLWYLGYPDQALKRSQEVVALADGLSHPFSLAYALAIAGLFHLLRREEQIALERAEAVIALSTEQGFPFWVAYRTLVRGAALAEQGQVAEGIAQMRQGLAAYRPLGAEPPWIGHLPVLVTAYAKVGQVEEGLSVVAETATALRDSSSDKVELAEPNRYIG